MSGILILIMIAILHQSATSNTTESYATFFAGVILLRHDPFLSEEQRAQGFRELELLSGVEGSRALKFLAKSRNNPEAWSKLQEEITKIIVDRGKQLKN